ncbi:hypothetical protein QTP86_010091 [Hemibagrus guttatus]|nr:hypothetical protein QTP86_010091 [Hemibagrus guttatus]
MRHDMKDRSECVYMSVCGCECVDGVCVYVYMSVWMVCVCVCVHECVDGVCVYMSVCGCECVYMSVLDGVCVYMSVCGCECVDVSVWMVCVLYMSVWTVCVHECVDGECVYSECVDGVCTVSVWTVCVHECVYRSNDEKKKSSFGKLHPVRDARGCGPPRPGRRALSEVEMSASVSAGGQVEELWDGDLNPEQELWDGDLNPEQELWDGDLNPEQELEISNPRSGRPAKITPKAQCRMLIEVKKDPRVTAKEFKDSLKLANISVHESAICRTMNRNGIHGRTPQRKPLHIAARLKFAKDHLDTPQHYWENVLWTDETEIELFGRNMLSSVWHKKKTAHQHENTIPPVKYGGVSIMVWGCFAASGPGTLAIVGGTMNSHVFQDILKDNLKVAVRKLKLRRSWVMEQDNNPKHKSKSTTERLQRHKIQLLEWPSQSPDLNPVVMLWNDLKRTIHTRRPKNMGELKQFCKEEWSKITPGRCAAKEEKRKSCTP